MSKSLHFKLFAILLLLVKLQVKLNVSMFATSYAMYTYRE